MSGWWLIVAFVAGWLTCWYFGNRLLRSAGLGKWLDDKAFRKMNHDSLLKLVENGRAELMRRRDSVKLSD